MADEANLAVLAIDPAIVRREQCRGSIIACVSCDQPKGERHWVLCYEYAKARQVIYRMAKEARGG